MYQKYFTGSVFSEELQRMDKKTGFTLVEILIAMVIFAIVSVVLLRAMTTADRIKSRGTSVMHVSVIARNESENIKNIGYLKGELNDTTYYIKYDKKEYAVERKIIESSNSDPFASKSIRGINEIEIIISEKQKTEQSWRFKLLQGHIN
jgi:prepilin-type N-terminal cleavage/methylation domain-containing protein